MTVERFRTTSADLNCVEGKGKMEDVFPLLKELGTEAEKKGQMELSGHSKKLKRAFYKVLTPVFFNIQTETDGFHFIFHKDSSVSLHRGLHAKPDVKFSSTHTELVHLLQTRDNKRFTMAEKTRKIKIVTTSFKGKEAVIKLRELFL